MMGSLLIRLGVFLKPFHFLAKNVLQEWNQNQKHTDSFQFQNRAAILVFQIPDLWLFEKFAAFSEYINISNTSA